MDNKIIIFIIIFMKIFTVYDIEKNIIYTFYELYNKENIIQDGLKFNITKLCTGNRALSNNKFDNKCSIVHKYNTLSPYSCLESGTYANCKILHEIELEHSWFGLVYKFCIGVDKYKDIETKTYDVIIFKINNFDSDIIFVNNSESLLIYDLERRGFLITPYFGYKNLINIYYSLSEEVAIILNISPWYIFDFMQRPVNRGIKLIDHKTVVIPVTPLPSIIKPKNSEALKLLENLIDRNNKKYKDYICTPLYSFKRKFCKEVYFKADYYVSLLKQNYSINDGHS